MTHNLLENLTFNDNTEMPRIGLGTWKLGGAEGVRAIRTAIELGYRHIDTASAYANEEVVGQAIAEAIAAGDVTREELFITTKAWNNEQGAAEIPLAFQRSLDRLGLEYVDLYLVHWPCQEKGLYLESFEAMTRLQGLGFVQSIGVANFYEEVLREVVEETGVVPALNQVELHPGFSQEPLRALHQELGVVTEAWSPLARGILLMNPVLDSIAREVGKTTAQVALNWAMELGCSVVPKSTHPKRLRQNLESASFKLSAEQVAAISALDDHAGFGRIFQDPQVFTG
ncbi:aldo/keto reductase [Corynebacterium alimapuense]|uniref:Aldo/keto reductase n=1 Tax=Corynebacterium alimapuense TaxID=1576874 RepID=A0A3M8K636_9CORY|nr:aldo/keto reductase [Corynebacterium alimapuense]RNE48636.1 aldo/keto reductase [Corynebacterium alimapuense]